MFVKYTMGTLTRHTSPISSPSMGERVFYHFFQTILILCGLVIFWFIYDGFITYFHHVSDYKKELEVLESVYCNETPESSYYDGFRHVCREKESYTSISPIRRTMDSFWNNLRTVGVTIYNSQPFTQTYLQLTVILIIALAIFFFYKTYEIRLKHERKSFKLQKEVLQERRAFANAQNSAAQHSHPRRKALTHSRFPSKVTIEEIN